MRLNGKRVLVTGGASGIGAAIVERFRAEGALVVIGAGLLALASCLAVLVVRQGGWSAMNLATSRFALGATAVITGAVLCRIRSVSRSSSSNCNLRASAACALNGAVAFSNSS